jgi:predicted translin family RNA/ssDNA-binding protein
MELEDQEALDGANDEILQLQSEVERLRDLLRQGRDLVEHALWDDGWPQEWVEAIDEALKEAGV